MNIVTDGRFNSKLGPYEAEIKALHDQGKSTRNIAAIMKQQHDINISHNAVGSFLRTHSKRARNFLDGIPTSRRIELATALKALWTHDSTAIEGNTLTLGDTIFVLQYGLTVKGKPLKDHDDVLAHASGIDLIQRFVTKGEITIDDILELHRTVVTSNIHDIYKPIGDWKREENGTYNAENGKPIYMPYASADETPQLMNNWVKSFNKLFCHAPSDENAVDAYLHAHVSFVRIHPFFDGNGRLARLLANLPVLFFGYPPIVIPAEARSEYINALWTYQRQVGTITLSHPELLPRPELLSQLRTLVMTWWQQTLDLVNAARKA